MWQQYVDQAEPAVTEREVLVQIAAGEMDERWLARDAQEREYAPGARLVRAIKRVLAGSRPPERLTLRRLEPRSS